MSTHEDASVAGLKRAAAKWSAEQLRDGMIVGLGSGSTAALAVAAIGERVKLGLHIIGIPTSERTSEQARRLSIPQSTLEEYPAVDLTIDGADEVEPGSLNLIKGGGGNHLREKIVASSSSRLMVIVDAGKVVDRLGARAKVPVEVAQFGWQATARKIQAIRISDTPVSTTLRLSPGGETFVTDGGNYILDCSFGLIGNAAELERALDGVVGVIEHGLFIGMASTVAVGTPDGVTLLTK